jgi:DNA polymerase elongation subunit (family B)
MSDVISVIFLSYDYEMIIPESPIHSKSSSLKLRKVPMIRVYGHLKDTGESTCLFIHGFYPFFHLTRPKKVSLLEIFETLESDQGGSIFTIDVESKFDIYGFHEHPEEMVKVTGINPMEIASMASKAQTKFPGCRVFGVHIPFLLQFLVENEIQGVSPIYFQRGAAKLKTQKTTTCQVELHINVQDILNSKKRKNTSTPASNKTYPLPKPLIMSEASQDLICGSCLDDLWEEESKRSLVFPYQSEGIQDGIDRPLAKDIPHVKQLFEELKDLVKEINGSPQVASIETEDLPPSQFDASLSDAEGDPENPDKDEDDDEEEPSIPTEPVLSTQLDRRQSSVLSTQEAQSSVPSSQNFNLKSLDYNSINNSFIPETEDAIFVFPPSPSNFSVNKKSSSQSSTSNRLSFSNTLPATMMTKKVLPPMNMNDHAVTYRTLLCLDLVVAQVDPSDINLNPERHSLISVIGLLRNQGNSKQDRTIYVTRSYGDPSVTYGTDEVILVKDEKAILETIYERFILEFDPAVMIAWDFSKYIMSYLHIRAAICGVHMNLSRLFDFNPDSPHSFHSPSVLPGRIVVSLWQMMRSDDSLKITTTQFEGLVLQLLDEKIPSIPMSTLCNWLVDPTTSHLTLQHLKRRVELMMKLVDTTMGLDKSVEMAKIYGCDVTSVMTRGSQFRVECMLSRAAKKENFLLTSSSQAQIKAQRAPEGIPLVLEPKSGFYSDPVCVLDFQSLYPSIMIAYNICYSTCLGILNKDSIVNLGTQRNYSRNLGHTLTLPGSITPTPGNIGFVGRETRLGIVPRMLHEIIQTRFMVKKSMKSHKSNPTLARQLDATQLALKLLANVTYGYTSASFSGRMPSAEVADSIVLTGRKTLETAMALAEELGGKVVYGDTDSLFVLFEGASLEHAFKKGQELADLVTARNPWPMKLQMEKVYWPSCMITKKRYCGRAFESPGGAPRFDAKGIETVRRDNCPLTGKTLLKVLTAVFEHPEISYPELRLLESLRKEIGRLIKEDGTKNIHNFVFQNQVRTDYKDPNHLPPAARVAANMNLEISRGQRVAYLVARRGPEALLSEQVVNPKDVTDGKDMIDLDYYIFKQILPALQRTLGIDLSTRMTQCVRAIPQRKVAMQTGRLDSFVNRQKCLVCQERAKHPAGSPLFCSECVSERLDLCIETACKNLRDSEKRLTELRQKCVSCAGSTQIAVSCRDAWHCDVYFDRELEFSKYESKRNDFLVSMNLTEAEW